MHDAAMLGRVVVRDGRKHATPHHAFVTTTSGSAQAYYFDNIIRAHYRPNFVIILSRNDAITHLRQSASMGWSVYLKAITSKSLHFPSCVSSKRYTHASTTPRASYPDMTLMRTHYADFDTFSII